MTILDEGRRGLAASQVGPDRAAEDAGIVAGAADEKEVGRGEMLDFEA